MLDLNNIAADRYHKGPLRKQFSPLVMASEDRDTAITNNHGGTNISTQWIDTMKTCRTRSKRRDLYLYDNRETID